MKILWLSGVWVFFGLMIFILTVFTELLSSPYYRESVLMGALALTVVFAMLPVIKNCKNWKTDVMKASYTLIIVAHVIIAVFVIFIATAKRGGGDVTFLIGIILIPAEIIVYLIGIIIGYLTLRSEYKKQ